MTSVSDQQANGRAREDELLLDLPSFLRLFERRGRSIMWLLGAGASRSAGIKTGWDMIWDFKRSIFRSQKGVRESALPDNNDPRTRRIIQRYFDDQGNYPVLDDPSEYAAYFEAAYHDERDRRRYIDEAVSSATPTHGHKVLAALMEKALCDIVWTTNFDRLVEDAAAARFKTTGRLSHGDLNNPSTVLDAISESNWPVYGKLHGDFQSRRLKNTAEELRSQDRTLRRALVDACRTRGLALIGYSGRDASVMEALREAIDAGGLSQGLYWFTRGDGEVFGPVTELLHYARQNDVDARLVEAQGFDEAMSELATFLPALEGLADAFRRDRKGRRAAMPEGKRGRMLPVVRTNAFPITSYPQMARLIDCKIGGAREVREVLEASGRPGIATRIRDGVIAFGNDNDLRAAFSGRDIEDWSTHPILDKRLAKETGERRLLRDALFAALSATSGLPLTYRRGETLVLANPRVVPSDRLVGLGYPRAVSGVVGSTGINWNEACSLRLDFKGGRLWLLLEPKVHLEWGEENTAAQRNEANEFVRERTARRYNGPSNSLLESWRTILLGSADGDVSLSAGSFDKGIGASFTISTVSGFSGRDV
ncbi:SIR2 family NAD-dependent protein deacylase [Parvularcula oceani]|uniref:SIR2 family NAD-dependent protein deacylase n=1 Tax=Parvularcula oceani TaxID=1247963 RepID=UPI00068C6F58|nr:SIR2 family protein [Parvularcula oceani]